MNCSVHRYKYSQDKRRSKLKKALQEGKVKFIGKDKTHFHYEILDMEYYKTKVKE